MSKHASVAAVLVAISLALTGCGSSDEERASKAIAESITKSDAETFPVDGDQAKCVGDGFVDGIGVEKLKDYGVLTDDLESSGNFAEDMEMSTDDAEAAADAMLECLDMQQAMADSFAEELGNEVPEAQQCVERSLTEETLKSFLVALFTGDETEAQEVLTADLMACLMGTTDDAGEDPGN